MKKTLYVPVISLRKETSDFEEVKITSAEGSADFIRMFYGDDIDIYESFFLLLLNQQNITIGFVKISQGGIAGTVVDTQIVAKYAIDSLAQSVILAHNHPSGNLTPSPNDRGLTKKVKEGLALFDIRVLDHIILTKKSWYSFLNNGEI